MTIDSALSWIYAHVTVDRMLSWVGADVAWGWLHGGMTAPPLVLVFAGVVGLCFGSFLNVVIHRLPRSRSIVWPNSHCPRCGRPLSGWENVPIVSFAVLGGRCRTCHAPIGWRYPMVEASGAALVASLTAWLGLSAAVLFAGAFVLLLVAIAAIDVEHRIIPDELSAGVLGLGLWARGISVDGIATAALGALFGFSLLWVLALVYRRVRGIDGLGGGDVKLAAGLGAFLGVPGMLLALVVAAGVGSLAGIALILARRGDGKTAVPFGAFLAPAAVLALVWGESLWRSYLKIMGAS